MKFPKLLRAVPFAAALAGAVAALSACADSSGQAAAYLSDESDGANWAAYGRTNGAQHFSPLGAIDQDTVGSLGLAWYMDLEPATTNGQPLAVDGVLYFATGLSIVHAVDARTGKELWRHDPQAAEKAGINLRFGWGVRGIAWWDGKIYTGTQDGRLIAIDAKTGEQVWSVQTFPPENASYISGAPRVFDGKVIIGFGGTTGASRGYVTAYDAESGKQLWRFWTVPGDPAKGFENTAMEMAAKTWAGEWWKFGGGGDVWNAITYDQETDTVLIGTGSGYPWNRQQRSADEKGDRGDNLFVCSIVALDAETGEYKWHYQTVPGETWDFDSAMDIELAELEIGGKPRKVIVHAPKNGFFYVIDRITGKLISAEPFARVTWAKKIDTKTGRPVEAPGVRFRDGKTVFISPTAMGAHSWMPMAYSPQAQTAYIPAIDFEMGYSDARKGWKLPQDRTVTGAVGLVGGKAMGRSPATGSLLAWSPVTQKKIWEVKHPTSLNGGVLATGGKLVFQGTVDGMFKAYAADTGKVLWSFDAKAPIMGTPISYEVRGKQYVTVMTGLGMNNPASAAAIIGTEIEKYGIDPVSQARRVLTFVLDGKAALPPRPTPLPAMEDPDFKLDSELLGSGIADFSIHCSHCHGSLAIGSSFAPDLRRSPVPASKEAFFEVVRNGALESRGMPRFGEFSDETLEGMRQYIRMSAARLRGEISDEQAAVKLDRLHAQ